MKKLDFEFSVPHLGIFGPPARVVYSFVFGRFLPLPFFKCPAIIIINEQRFFLKNVVGRGFWKNMLTGFTKANLKNVVVLPPPPTRAVARNSKFRKARGTK